MIIGFDSKTLSVSESQSAIAVLRVINGTIASGDSKTIKVTCLNGTALGKEYQHQIMTLVWRAGNGIDFHYTQSHYTFTDTKTVHFVSVTIVKDTLHEQIESFQLLASSSDAGVTVDPDRVDIRIINREPTGKLNGCG